MKRLLEILSAVSFPMPLLAYQRLCDDSSQFYTIFPGLAKNCVYGGSLGDVCGQICSRISLSLSFAVLKYFHCREPHNLSRAPNTWRHRKAKYTNKTELIVCMTSIDFDYFHTDCTHILIIQLGGFSLRFHRISHAWHLFIKKLHNQIPDPSKTWPESQLLWF